MGSGEGGEIKGSLNEYELDLLRQRLLSARYDKARRGELVVTAPVALPMGATSNASSNESRPYANARASRAG